MAKKEEQLGEPEEQFPADAQAVDAAVTSAMQTQAKVALYNLIKQCEALGVDLKEMFPQPPTTGDVISTAPGVANFIPPAAPQQQYQQQQQNPYYQGQNYQMQPVAAPRRPGAPVYPGAINSPWYEWQKEDLDPNDSIEFVPAPIPGIVWPRLDEYGRAKIKIDVNNLCCWLTVGEVNRVNRMFYNVYMDSYNQWKLVEDYKRRGPEGAPWGMIGPNGQPSWFFEPFAVSNGMNLDGRALVAGEKTIDQELAELGKSELLDS